MYLDEFSARSKELRRVVDVLNDLHAAYYVIPLGLFEERLSGGIYVAESPKVRPSARPRKLRIGGCMCGGNGDA
jgi:hypothetical protein